jgi:hypothetical protein
LQLNGGETEQRQRGYGQNQVLQRPLKVNYISFIMYKLLYLLTFLLLTGLITGCATTQKVSTPGNKNFHSSTASADSITARIPNYKGTLSSVKGKAKAIVSGPEKSNRVTLHFSGNRQKSLIIVKNNIGIKGAKILANGDSLLIYNKVDNYARKISVKRADINGIDHLASINLLKLLNYPLKKGDISSILANKKSYLLRLQSGGSVYISKKNDLIQQIQQPPSSGMPYSKIIYSGYNSVEGLTLPRKITIFSTDQSTRIDLLVQSLTINPSLGKLTIDLPRDIKIYHR